MPNAPRRRLTRRPPPRPTFGAAAAATPDAPAPAPHEAYEVRRAAQHGTRQVPYLVAELKRVASVTGVCLAILAVLTVVDRMR